MSKTFYVGSIETSETKEPTVRDLFLSVFWITLPMLILAALVSLSAQDTGMTIIAFGCALFFGAKFGFILWAIGTVGRLFEAATKRLER
jgi:hypothetical protein